MNLVNPATLTRCGVFALFLLAGSAAEAHAQSVLTGKILALDSSAISAARVTVHDSTSRSRGETMTDSAGEFRLRIHDVTESQTIYLSVVRVGFASLERVPVELRPGEDARVRVHMSPNAVNIAPVSVVARQRHSPVLSDYYDKLDQAKKGQGRGLDREVMKRYAGMELIKALQLIPGVENGRSMLSEGVTLTVPRMRGGCIPLTFLDRVIIAPDQLATMDPEDLEGVLVYIGGEQLPPDFSRIGPGTECGMILAYRIPPSGRKSSKSILNVMIILGAFAAVASSFGW